MSNEAVSVLVFFRIKPGKEEEFKRHLVDMTTDFVRKEPNCLQLYMHQDPHDPTRFMLYENWVDKGQFLSEQLQQPYFTPYVEATEPLWAEPRRLTLWTMIEREGEVRGNASELREVLGLRELGKSVKAANRARDRGTASS